MSAFFPVIRLPGIVETNLWKMVDLNWHPASTARMNFSAPLSEAALVAHDSVSWRVFKNPIALLIGGIAAVVLELAEPRIRTAIWQHSTFRADPLGRLQRTGIAALATIYGARSVSVPMIARITRIHAQVSGATTSGVSYSAQDPDLLAWVHATATYSFAAAYSRFVDPLNAQELDAVCQESIPVSRLYGIPDAPQRFDKITESMQTRRVQLEASPAVHDFLAIMRDTPLLPPGLRWLQPAAARAALQIIPNSIVKHLGLASAARFSRKDDALINCAGALANRVVLPSSAACQACVRLGLPPTYLYR